MIHYLRAGVLYSGVYCTAAGAVDPAGLPSLIMAALGGALLGLYVVSDRQPPRGR